MVIVSKLIIIINLSSSSNSYFSEPWTHSYNFLALSKNRIGRSSQSQLVPKYMVLYGDHQVRPHRPLITCRGPTMSSMDSEVEILNNDRCFFDAIAITSSSWHDHHHHHRDHHQHHDDDDDWFGGAVVVTLGATPRPITSTLLPLLK